MHDGGLVNLVEHLELSLQMQSGLRTTGAERLGGRGRGVVLHDRVSTNGDLMTARDVVATLKKLGKPQTAAIYRRHGSGDDVFGVLTSDIARLSKKFKVDDSLATELWKTGNAEARVLALQIADPAKLTPAAADALVRESSSHFLTCYISELVARSPIAEKTMRAWMKSPREFTRATGYEVLARRLKDDPGSIDDAGAATALATIEKEIHRSANFARYAMNGALIAIGVYKPSLRKEAVEVARRIGEVVVDHGETGCKTPDARSYIEKASSRTRASRSGAALRTARSRAAGGARRRARSPGGGRRPR
jgi:3-methyladenine DNA glycosylase AlkD